MSMTKDEAIKKLADVHYGPGAAVGDGSILKMLFDMLKGLLGTCSSASRAHDAINCGPWQQGKARRRMAWAAYDMTGDWEESQKMAATGMTVGKSLTVEDFNDIAAMPD